MRYMQGIGGGGKGRKIRRTSLNEFIQTQSPFCRPAAWKPATSFLTRTRAWLSEMEFSAFLASMYIYQ